jgi:hypothetical protein
VLNVALSLWKGVWVFKSLAGVTLMTATKSNRTAELAARRLAAVKFFEKGWNANQLACHFDVTYRAAWKWKIAWERDGCAGLAPKPRPVPTGKLPPRRPIERIEPGQFVVPIGVRDPRLVPHGVVEVLTAKQRRSRFLRSLVKQAGLSP